MNAPAIDSIVRATETITSDVLDAEGECTGAEKRFARKGSTGRVLHAERVGFGAVVLMVQFNGAPHPVMCELGQNVERAA